VKPRALNLCLHPRHQGEPTNFSYSKLGPLLPHEPRTNLGANLLFVALIFR